MGVGEVELGAVVETVGGTLDVGEAEGDDFGEDVGLEELVRAALDITVGVVGVDGAEIVDGGFGDGVEVVADSPGKVAPNVVTTVSS